MKLIRKNHPFILGWLSYAILFVALNMLLVQTGYMLIQRYLPTAQGLSVTVPALILSALSSLLGFLISVKWVTQPLFKRATGLALSSKRGYLLLRWMMFAMLVFIYTLPLALISFIPASKTTLNAISWAWRIIISFITYKNIVSDYVLEVTQKPLPEIDQRVAME